MNAGSYNLPDPICGVSRITGEMQKKTVIFNQNRKEGIDFEGAGLRGGGCHPIFPMIHGGFQPLCWGPPWVRPARWLSPNTWSTRVQWLPFVLRVVRRTASSSHFVSCSYMAGIALVSAAPAFVSLPAARNFARSVPPHDLADSSPITKGFPVGGTALPEI